MKFFLTALGLVCFLEGLPYFAFPETLKWWLRKIPEIPEGRLRLLGGLLMILGLALVYMGKQFGEG